MGCGASSDPKVGVSDSIKPVNTKNANETSPSKNKHKSQYSDPRNLPDTNNGNYTQKPYEQRNFHLQIWNFQIKYQRHWHLLSRLTRKIRKVK